MKKGWNVIFIGLFMALLFTPWLFQRWDERLALSGVSYATTFDGLSLKTVWAGEAQSNLDEYVQENMPGRNLMIRLRNEIVFSVMGKSPNENISVGKNDILFENHYIRDYEQYRAPLSEEEIAQVIQKIESFQDLVAASGRQVFVYITPCKPRYYEQDIPGLLQKNAPERAAGDYDRFVAGLEQSSIKYFDSIQCIAQYPFDARVPLFYRTGTHWAQYVGNCVGVEFGEFLEQESGFNMPEAEVSVEPIAEPIWPDADIFLSLNLLRGPYDDYYEPVVTITDAAADAPGVFCRGGSFMGQSISTLVRNQYFGKNVHMENTTCFTDEYTHTETFESYDAVDLAGLLKDTDIVVLEVNEDVIGQMSFGFMDYVLEHPECLAQ